MRFSTACLSFLLLALTAGAAYARQWPVPGIPLGAEYVDADSYLTTDADIEAWYNATSRLRQNFDAICGDTFCEGDYSNIQSLSFRCSVEKHTGIVGQCVWIFAASNEDVRPGDGHITVDSNHWRCRSPLARTTRIGDLLIALSGPQPLRALLPGTSRSIYDGLVDCL
ncbi:MAG: hypothetical protein ABI870_04050 [Rhodanobacter sp.]